MRGITMGLPFKNGAELASALGYGDLYKAAEEKEAQETSEGLEMTENVKKMMGKMDEIFKRNLQEIID